MSVRFNPPPFWQQYLPANFTPAVDWTPEQTWGAPPAGWALWINTENGYPANPPEEYRNNPYLFLSVVAGMGVPEGSHVAMAAPIAQPKASKKPMRKGMKIFLWIAGIFVFLGIVSSCSNDAEPEGTPAPAPAAATSNAPAQPSVSETPVSQPTVDPEPVEEEVAPEPEPKVTVPKAQQSFSDRVAKATQEYQDTDNELRMSKAITDRDKALCKATGGTFEGWKATIHDIGSTGDGYGYIAIIIDEDIELSTWNNALSDIGDNSLIKPSNKLFDKLLDMSSGDTVTVSGTFLKDNGTCVKTSNMSEAFNATSPDFKVKFSSIKADK